MAGAKQRPLFWDVEGPLKSLALLCGSIQVFNQLQPWLLFCNDPGVGVAHCRSIQSQDKPEIIINLI
jgi:hypothetical protein